MTRSITETQLRSVIRGLLAEAEKGMLYSSPECPDCGGRIGSDGSCEKCGARMEEYVARGLSNMGRVDRVTEREGGKGGLPKTRAAAKKMVAKLAKDPGPTWGDVTQYAKGWGAENPDAYASVLLRMAGGEKGKRRKGG